jgi:hypothetical protein
MEAAHADRRARRLVDPRLEGADRVLAERGEQTDAGDDGEVHGTPILRRGRAATPGGPRRIRDAGEGK